MTDLCLQGDRTRLIDRLLSFSLKSIHHERTTQITDSLSGRRYLAHPGRGSFSPQWKAYTCLKIIYLSINQFINDRIVVRASALTYSTLLSIIPILALLFAIARGFGFDTLIESQFRSGVTGAQAELVISWINSYLEHAQSGIFIGVGLIMLLGTVLLLIDNIERSFNAIWQVKKPRGLFRQITDYSSLILLLPVLLVVSSGLSIFMSTYVKELQNFMVLAPVLKFFVRLIPYALIWGMFIGLYTFMPNTKVKLAHAWLPGILAGSAFQAFQYFYINSQIWVSNYNAIYGSFAAIPLFLLWTQISWSICLFGAEMSYISQNISTFNFGKETANISRRFHDFFCTIILSSICKRFATLWPTLYGRSTEQRTQDSNPSDKKYSV